MSGTATPPAAETVNARTIFDLAAETTEHKVPGSAPTHTWTPENKPPETTPPTPGAEPVQPKYTDAYYKLSAKNTAGMTAQIVTLFLDFVNKLLARWRTGRIMSTEDFNALEEKELKDKTTLSAKELRDLKRYRKIGAASDKLEDETKFSDTEEALLSEAFYDYQKFTEKPLTPTILIWFNIGKKVLKVANAYIFS